MVPDELFAPESVAIIGASRRKGSIGRTIVENMLRYGYEGVIYPINPKAKSIAGIKCYPSVLDIDDRVDTAIIAVPACVVPSVLEDCGKKGVKCAVIISAGFREVGEEGARLEDDVLSIAKKYGIRVVGPNCMGVINSAPSIRLAGTFAPVLPSHGNVGFVSQSGALGIAILDYAEEINMGISKFVSVGNGADLGVEEMLEYLGNDDDTDVILLYIESMKKPRVFVDIARRVSRKKPIIAVKAGRTEAGARAAASHTGALASSWLVVRSALKQGGVIIASSVDELFDYALAFSLQPIPRGRRVAILTNGGGPGILATDACVSEGLEMAKLSMETVQKMRKILPSIASLKNPVDVTPMASIEDYENAAKCLLSDDGVDALISIFVPPTYIEPADVAMAVSRASEGGNKPVLGVFMGKGNILYDVEHVRGRRIPAYLFPESAARALSAMCERAEFLARGERDEIAMEIKYDVLDFVGDKHGVLSLNQSLAIAEKMGFKTPRYVFCAREESLQDFAKKIGYPLVIKAVVEGKTHKTEFGGVAIDIGNEEELIDKANKIVGRLKDMGIYDKFAGFVLQEMVSGIEVIIGGLRDEKFGPLVMLGVGGIFVEIMRDISFRIAPIARTDALEMMAELKAGRIFEGFRGRGVNKDEIIDAIVRASRVIASMERIKEMEFNPVIVNEEGAFVVDARFVLK